MAKGCTHIAGIRSVTPSALGCEECLKSGSVWLHLRICPPCGHVGCSAAPPNSTRPGLSPPPTIRSLKATIRRKGGAGAMSMRCYSICRTERRRITVRSRAIIDGGLRKYRVQSAIRICHAVGALALVALSMALLDRGEARAQTPQHKFAELNGVRLHYL